jgi:hypothetical protein
VAVRHLFPLSPGGPNIVRELNFSLPVDWYDQVVNNGPLPVVAFVHGGGQYGSEFMSTTFRIDEWWQGVFAGTPIKAIAFAPQGIGINGLTGEWNAGNIGTTVRLFGVDDLSYFFDELDRLEQFLLDAYANDIQPVTGGLNMTQVFDRSRLMLVGFSNGGQLAYRLVTVAPRPGGRSARSRCSARRSGAGIERSTVSRQPRCLRTPTGLRQSSRRCSTSTEPPTCPSGPSRTECRST